MDFSKSYKFEIIMEADFSISDISGEIESFVSGSGLKQGIVNAFVEGSTASVTTTEYEPGTSKDLRDLFYHFAPYGKSYEHHKTWNDGNGHSHLQSSVLGPSVTIPVSGYKLQTGTWQQIVVINHDTRKRRRNVFLTAIGDFD